MTLRQQVAQSGLSGKVVFTGFRPDVSDCLSAFDIFVLPSLAESHSIALLEAMQAGKAIVATDVGGNTESVRQGKEGIIVSPADPDGLAKAIERYIKFPELAIQMGKNAKLRFDNQFTVDVMVKKTAEWMISCCADK
jgi:glycosyltransferase involved in cell wall biosynthesis